jgi:8-oxo-dGTP diphosphatase
MESKEQRLLEAIKELQARLPRLPDGRIDYSGAERAAVVTCFVRFRGRILLLKRSEQVGTYRGLWHTVAGYLDELKPLREKILEELEEELSLGPELIAEIRLGEPYEFADPSVGKTWLVQPALVELKDEPALKLDREHTEHRWITPEEIRGYPTVPRLEESLRRVL